MDIGKASAFNDFTIFHKFPCKDEFGQVREIVSVLYLHTPCRKIHGMELDILIDLLCLRELRRGPPVRSHKSVAAEVPVVRSVPEIPSIIEFVVRPADLVDALVHPVPDAGSDHSLGIFNVFPIFGKVPGSISH